MKHGGDRRGDQGANLPLDTVSVSQAATLLNVSERTVKDGRKVVAKGVPELAEAVVSGEIAISAAAQLVDLPERDQTEIAMTKDKKERTKKVAEAKTRSKADKATRKDLVLTNGPSCDSERCYSVEEWKALPVDTRTRIIQEGFESRKAKMNEQPTDSIEWARWSLNTVTGCLNDCPYCYAREFAERRNPHGFRPTFYPSRLAAPGRTKMPAEARGNIGFRNIFANSMSDLFGPWVPDEWIIATIEMAKRNKLWNFLVLTKYPARATEFAFPENWWQGTTVDKQARVEGAEKAFESIDCKVKWLSVEPLLEPLQFTRLDLFQWIVIGGASRSASTPAWVPPIDWLVGLHQQARDADLRIYYKTNVGMQDELRLREYPGAKTKEKVLPSQFRK